VAACSAEGRASCRSSFSASFCRCSSTSCAAKSRAWREGWGRDGQRDRECDGVVGGQDFQGLLPGLSSVGRPPHCTGLLMRAYALCPSVMGPVGDRQFREPTRAWASGRRGLVKRLTML
jgi:hypothetical protein